MSVFSSDVPMPTQYQRSLGQTEGDWPVQPPWPNEEYEVDLSQRSDHIQQEYRREGQSRSYELTSSGDKSFEQDSRHVGAQFEPYKPEDTASTVEYDTDTSSHLLASEHSLVDEDGFQNRPLLSSGRLSPDPNSKGLLIAHRTLFSEADGSFLYAASSDDVQMKDHDILAEDHQSPSILVSDPSGRRLIPVADDVYNALPAEGSTTPQRLVGQVYHSMCSLNGEWMKRLGFTPDLFVYCSKFSRRSLLEIGIRTVQACFRGSLPTKFEEIFALMHIAVACSLVNNKIEIPGRWNLIASDLRRWHQAIEDSTENLLFIRIWNRLWAPQKSMSTVHQKSDLANKESRDELPEPRATSQPPKSNLNASFLGIGFPPRRPQATDHNDFALLQHLIGGIVVKECCCFLDGKSTNLMLMLDISG